jgi:hypothetical protein
MTILTRNPTNTNLLQPTKFLMSFDRIRDTQYFLQAVNLPGITGQQIRVPTPGLDYYSAGDKIEYNNLSITFILDEEMLSWRNIHKWFRSFASPEGTTERKALAEIQEPAAIYEKSPYSDGVLNILTNLNNTNFRIDFYNLFPISLSDVDFDTRLSADHTMTATATFVYDYYNIYDTAPDTHTGLSL